MIRNMSNDREWLLKMAATEDYATISVGGLAAELGDLGEDEHVWTPSRAKVSAFSKVVELRRRERRLTIEQLAEQTDVDVEEIVVIESSAYHDIEPRTVFQLAEALKLPVHKLLVLSGLAEARDEELDRAVVRFAARSKSIGELTEEEREALDEFVRFLGKA